MLDEQLERTALPSVAEIAEGELEQAVIGPGLFGLGDDLGTDRIRRASSVFTMYGWSA